MLTTHRLPAEGSAFVCVAMKKKVVVFEVSNTQGSFKCTKIKVRLSFAV